MSFRSQENYDQVVREFEKKVEAYVSMSPEDRATYRKEFDELTAEREKSVQALDNLCFLEDVIAEGERRLAGLPSSGDIPKTKEEWLEALSACVGTNQVFGEGYLDEGMAWEVLKKAARYLEVE